MKRNIIYILLICVSFFSNSIFAFKNEIPITIQDTLIKDYSNIEPKHFGHLLEKYNTSEFIYERSINDLSWWTRFKIWLSEVFTNLFRITSKGQASNIVDILIKIAGVTITLLVIYFIFKAIINKEGKWVFGQSSDKSIIPNVSIEQNIHATNFKSLISTAEKEKNHRLVIRYYYLWLLKELALKEVIEYDIEKTNSDYQYEIKDNKLDNKFAYTSYLYNHIWYGEFNIDQDEFQKSKSAFINFLNDLK